MIGKTVLIGDMGTLAANGTFTKNFPLQGAYKDIFIRCKDSSGDEVAYGSDISTVSLIAGEASIIPPIAPAVIDSLNLYFNAARGAIAVTGVIPLDLTPNGLFDEISEAAYMLGCVGLSALKVQIVMGDALANVSTIEVWATHYTGTQNGINFDAMGLGRHTRLAVETQTTTGTGEKAYDAFSYVGDAGVGLLAVIFANASGTGTASHTRVDTGNSVTSMIPVSVDQANQRGNFRTPQGNYYVRDFALGNSPYSFLPLSTATRLKTTVNWTVNPAAEQNIYTLTLHGIVAKVGA